MKESLITSLRLKIWGVCWLVLMVLMSTTLHQDLNIFLPGELSHSLLVSTTGRWMWRAVATGPLDFVMTPGQRENDLTLDSKGIFLLLCIKENSQYSLFTSSPVTSICQKASAGQVRCSWIMMVESWAFNVANSSLICSFLYCSFSSPLKHFFALDTHDQRSKLWPQVSEMWII